MMNALKTSKNRQALIFFGFIYIGITILFSQLGYLDNIQNRIRGNDSTHYYIYLPSLLFDFDIDFSNDLSIMYGDISNIPFTSTGLLPNVFSIGPAIFWLPFFILGHILSLLSQLGVSPKELNGYSEYYKTSVYIGNSLYMMIGIYFSYLFSIKYTSKINAVIGNLSILLASQLTYDIWPIIPMSHSVSFMSSALFLYVWSRQGISPLLAICAALMTLSRWQNIILLMPAAIQSALLIYHTKNKKDFTLLAKQLGIFSCIFLLGIFPQLLAWKILYGSFLTVPQGEHFLDFSSLPVVQLLFGLRHGLFSWHPILLIGLIGLFYLYRHNKLLLVSFALIFIIQTIVNAAVDDWWAGWSFGQRRFDSCLPYFALGFALCLEYSNRARKILLIFILGCLVIWNQLFLYQYNTGLIPREKTITLSEWISDKFFLSNAIDSRIEAEKALFFIREQDWETAIPHATRSYQLNPQGRYPRSVTTQLCVYYLKNAACDQLFQQWLKNNPTDNLALLGLAEMALNHEQPKTAQQYLETLDDQQPYKTLLLKSIVENTTTLTTDARYQQALINDLER